MKYFLIPTVAIPLNKTKTHNFTDSESVNESGAVPQLLLSNFLVSKLFDQFHVSIIGMAFLGVRFRNALHDLDLNYSLN